MIMGSIIIKFFTGMIALMIVHRIVSTVFALVFCFLLYKYFTDPKYITNLFKAIKDLVDGFGGTGLPKPETTKETLAFLF